MVSAFSRDKLLNQPGMSFVDAILSKPVTPSALYNAIIEALRNREPEFKPAPVQSLLLETKERRLAGLRILVVDDSDINREIAQRILSMHGALVHLVEDGQEAIGWLSQHPDGIDIILMDVQMPGMDGYEATRLIRQNPLSEHIPIIALTAGVFTVEKDAARNSGMDDFVSKPFNVDQLIKAIQRFTGGYPESAETRPPAAGQSNSFPGFKPEESGLNMPTLSGIDFDDGINRFGNEAAYHAYLGRFVANYVHAGEKIANYIQLNEIEAASALIHKLKGVAGNLGLKNVANCASQLEARLMTGATTGDRANNLQQAIDEACAAISKLTMSVPGTDEEAELTKVVDGNTEELVDLLEQLLHGLDQDSPTVAEPLLLLIKTKIPAAKFALIKEQLDMFDFRGAEDSTNELIQKLKQY